MDPRIERERELFSAALERSDDERDDWLRSACADEPGLLERVRRLLAAHRRAEGDTGGVGVAPSMPRDDPERVGPFRVLERIGEGGMGVVYAAEQTQPVRRRVALKLIKLGMDTREVIARFESERQALALMSHPNIAGMLDAGATEGGRPYFVMEHVRGVPITEYCDARRLDVDARLELLLHVCSAVQHAHGKGVVHRDLKPSNILVADQDGEPAPKIIDFGIAKATHQRLTELTVYTELGRIIGTPEYMSPEQAGSSPLDADGRTDVYSLGVILYELLTGTRPFEFGGLDRDYGEIQRIVREEEPESPSDRVGRLTELVPAVAARRSTTPAALERRLRGELDWIVARALEKSPGRRYGTAADLAEDIRRHLDGEPLQVGPPGPGYRARKFLTRHRGTVGAVLLAIVAVAAGAVLASVGPLAGLIGGGDSAPPIRSTVMVDEAPLWLGASRSVAVSPRGDRIAYIGRLGTDTALLVRDLDRYEARPLRGTEGALAPFFSPDGRTVGFFQRGRLMRVAADGTRLPEPIVEVEQRPRGASWSEGGRIAYSPGGSPGILAVPAGGGEPEPLSRPDLDAGELEHQWPVWLPGDRGVLFTLTREGDSGIEMELAVLDLRSGVHRGLGIAGAQPAYVPSGHLVYAHAGTLEAVPFDLGSLEPSGPATTVLDAVRSYPAPYYEGAAYFDVSRSGALLYVPEILRDPVRLVWVGADGVRTPVEELPGTPGWPRVSPDGRSVAMHLGVAGSRDVWILDLARGSLRQLTFEGGGFPVWSPDSRRIAFMSRRDGRGDIWVMRVDRSAAPTKLIARERLQIPVSWSSRGVLAYYDLAGSSQRDVWTVEVDGGEPRPFVVSPANELAPAFSPDGRWIAYVSDETGRNEVYVRPYPPPGPVVVASTDGGSEPLWRHDGRELFYRRGDTIVAVSTESTPELVVGAPRLVYEGDLVENSGGNPSFDRTEDGRWLLLQSPDPGRDRLRLILNWLDELRVLAPAGS